MRSKFTQAQQEIDRIREDKHLRDVEHRLAALFHRIYGETWRDAMLLDRNECTEEAAREMFELIDTGSLGCIQGDEAECLVLFFAGRTLSFSEVVAAVAEMARGSHGEVGFESFWAWWSAHKLRIQQANMLEDDLLTSDKNVHRQRQLTFIPSSRTADGKVVRGLRAVFDEYDVDGSGRIDMSELTDITTRMRGATIAPEEIHELLQDIDKNNDGESSTFSRVFACVGWLCPTSN